MAKHKHQTLLDSGMTEQLLVCMMRAGLLRYDSASDTLWTLSPPSTWKKSWRSQWKTPGRFDVRVE